MLSQRLVFFEIYDVKIFRRSKTPLIRSNLLNLTYYIRDVHPFPELAILWWFWTQIMQKIVFPDPKNGLPATNRVKKSFFVAKIDSEKGDFRPPIYKGKWKKPVQEVFFELFRLPNLIFVFPMLKIGEITSFYNNKI